MAFFQDIATKFGLLPQLGKQLWKTAESQATAKRLEAQLAEVQKPKPKPLTTGGFFTDIAERFNLAKPQEFVTPETPIIKSAIELGQEVREKISKPLVGALPFGIGERLSVTPEQEQMIREKYKTYTFADVGKDLTNMGLNWTVNVLSDLGLAGQEWITGEKVGAGAGFGFKDAKTFQPAVIGSVPGIYQYHREQGDSPFVAGARTGIQFGFDLLIGFGIAKQGLPATRYAVRQLPESLLYKFKAENMPVEEVIGSLTGAKPTPKGTAFIQGLSNEEKKSLFGLARSYERAGGQQMEVVEKAPTALGKFAGIQPTKFAVETRPAMQLPGTAIVGKPQPAFGLSIRPVKKVGGVPEIPKDLQPLAQEARKYKSAEEFVKANKKIFRGGERFDPQRMEGRGASFSFSKDVADYWRGSRVGGVFEEFYLSPNAKIYKPTAEDIKLGKIIPPEGFDAIDVSKIAGQQEIRIFNPEIVKTKSQLTDFYNQAIKGVKEVKPTEEEMLRIEKEVMEFGRDEIDDIIAGKIKMRPPAGDVKTDWRESLGAGNYMRIFGGGKFASPPDEIATDLGMTEDELKEAIVGRIFKREELKIREGRIKAEQEPRELFEEKEITIEDLEKLWGTSPKLENITPPPPTKPPVKPTVAGMPEEIPKRIIPEKEKAMVKGYSRKVIDDLNALGGLENENIIQDLNEIGGYNFRDIGELKEVLSIGEEIIKPIRIRAEKLTPEQKEINKLIMRIEKEQTRMLNLAQREAIKNLHNIAKPTEATTFYRKEEIQSWIKAIKRLQSEKELSSMTVARIKKSLQIDNIKRSDQPKLQELYEFMSKLEKGDAFLSGKQQAGLIEILKDIERIDLVPKRVVIDKFGEKDEVMGKGIMGRILNELVPSVDIKEGHPLISKIVDKSDNLLFEAEKEIQRRDKQFAEMISKAEKSRKLPIGEKVKRVITPQNKEIFTAMSGQKISLTEEEAAVVAYLRNFFKEVRDDLKLEKYRQNYITHLEQPLLEKIVNDGVLKAVVDIFKMRKKDTIPINIMLELDNIIGSEKFFRFALERKGGLTPTTNIRKILHTYSSLYETKKALDQILPEGQAVVQLLLKPKTAVWTKKFLQNLKGRGLDANFRTGKMAWLSRLADGIVDVGYFKLLGLNYWSALKNLTAGEANSFIYQDFYKFLQGKGRLATNPKKAVKMALDYGILEGTFADYAQRGIGKLKRLQDLAMIGQRGGEYEIRTSIFAGELKPEEWASGKISPERVRGIKDTIAITQGIFSKTDSPLWLQTWYGRLIMQMNRWRITNAMLLRRLTVNALKEPKVKKHYFKLAKAFLMYGLGMYLSWELGKAGHKKAAKVAQSMAEAINSVIELVTLEPIVSAIADNPTYSVLKEIAFSIQELANYIGVPGVEEPRKLEFRRGIEETWIAPIERPKELLGIDEEPQKAKDILLKYGIGGQTNQANEILKKYGIPIR